MNVFPLVSTDPRALKSPIAQRSLEKARSENIAHIRNIAARTTLVLGFGHLLTQPWLREVSAPALRELVRAVENLPTFALALTANGLPRHPLARGKAHIASCATFQPYDVTTLPVLLDYIDA